VVELVAHCLEGLFRQRLDYFPEDPLALLDGARPRKLRQLVIIDFINEILPVLFVAKPHWIRFGRIRLGLVLTLQV
jgi:hypothetical protein